MKFRVRFRIYGWEVQSSRLGIFWRSCGYTYRLKAVAEEVAGGLRVGVADAAWFKETLDNPVKPS